MTFGQFLALLAFVAAALPLGAIGMIALLYGAVALGRAPVEAAVLFERLAGRGYCWTMVGILAAAILLIGGWMARLLLLAVAATFLRGALDVLPKLETLRDGGPVIATPAMEKLARRRPTIAGSRAAQFPAVLYVFSRLVL